MTKNEFLNKKYLTLCQQLGDATLKQEQLNEHIQTLKNQIKQLNETFPIMAEFEAVAKAADVDS